jgi:hypothetical protein
MRDGQQHSWATIAKQGFLPSANTSRNFCLFDAASASMKTFGSLRQNCNMAFPNGQDILRPLLAPNDMLLLQHTKAQLVAAAK